jgi:antitoxin ParD1/3/4
MSLNVSLPIELENRVREHVASGLYGSASEVIREALRIFEAYQSMQAKTLAVLKADIAEGMKDLRAGNYGPIDLEEFKKRNRAELKKRGKA